MGWRSVKNYSVYHSYVDSCDIYDYDYNGVPYVLLSAYYEKA